MVSVAVSFETVAWALMIWHCFGRNKIDMATLAYMARHSRNKNNSKASKSEKLMREKFANQQQRHKEKNRGEKLKLLCATARQSTWCCTQINIHVLTPLQFKHSLAFTHSHPNVGCHPPLIWTLHAQRGFGSSSSFHWQPNHSKKREEKQRKFLSFLPQIWLLLQRLQLQHIMMHGKEKLLPAALWECCKYFARSTICGFLLMSYVWGVCLPFLILLTQISDCLSRKLLDLYLAEV